MSYVRFGWRGSSVYVYLDCAGYLNCCGCILNGTSTEFFTTGDMLAHLEEHRRVGHTVLDETFIQLNRDEDDNDAWMDAYAEDSRSEGE